MTTEPAPVARPISWRRADRPAPEPVARRAWPKAAVVAAAVGFVLLGGGNLDLGPVEAKLGIAAMAGFGPLGQLFGGWEPSLWPAQIVPSVLWSWGEWGIPTSASVRWPAAIAGVAIGLLLALRVRDRLGSRAAVLVALCWYGSLALIDRSAGAGIDLITALGTVAALDRILGRGSGIVAGLWGSCAFLAGGWPPLAVMALALMVIGRRETALSWTMLAPVALTVVAWSAWALASADAEVWAAALALPLTQKADWWLAPGVLALGLPWSPLAALSAARSVREGWSPRSRALVFGWLQVTGACLVAGTVIPGLATAAKVPALAGVALASAACAERLWAGAVSPAARRRFQAAALALVVLWTLLTVAGGGYLATAVGYYRGVAVLLAALGVAASSLALAALLKADARGSLLALVAVAVCLKIAHWGYYVPEWNYRRSQGPWGRAIGQWVPPRWPIYTTHTWPTDLAFATRHPFRQLADPRLLEYQPGSSPKFVLLVDAEFEHWPQDAPALVKVAALQDERGQTRVLARTAGDLSFREIARSRHAAE